ncbi:MAG TPA: CerR family C-terminal domain-containing protein [Bryobacteraceae bacterium]|nr:CerR family C-terminal domain-containing protein [Bryobacteraceae bacterium]
MHNVSLDTTRIDPPPGESADATETKLLAAAGEVFCESGFHAATVREICARAGTNVAAVNYHFGDKVGLYLAVLRYSMEAPEFSAIRTAMAQPGSPEDRLRAFVHQMFRKMHGADRPAWYFKIMAHEMAHPSPALPRVVEEIMRPNYRMFSRLVGEIIGRPPDDAVTRMCLHSVISQVIHYMHGRPVLSRLWPELKMTPERMDQIADHIANLSLAGFAAVARQPKNTAIRRRRVR